MEKIFGWEFKREGQMEWPSFAPKELEDGAVVVAAGGYGTFIDLEGTVRSEAELISKYREMALHPEVDSAIEEIVNDAVTKDDNDEVVKISLDNTELSDKIKTRVEDEFKQVLKILKFKTRFHDIFRRWYIDGRLNYHAIIDEKSPSDGIKELRYIDPRKIKKVREVIKKRVVDPVSSEAGLTQVKNEYFIYNDKGFNVGMKSSMPSTTGIKIARDAVLQCFSGVTDAKGSMILSHLHQGIKALNQLRVLEDATIIYRISRAPERRVWYIDVGQLPRMKAEQYVRDIMTKHKNRLVYDGATGEIRDDRRFMNMMEDYWLPRRGDTSSGTKVETLPAGQNLGQMEDVEYFQRRLYASLNVPIERLNQQEAVFDIGRPSQITREELKFGKFIDGLRSRFSDLFIFALEKQLVLKKVMSLQEFEAIKDTIRFVYMKDSYITELKDNEINTIRWQSLQLVEPYIGRYYSNYWIRKNILKQSEDDMKQIDKEIEEESEKFQYLSQDEKMMYNQADMEQQQMQQQADQEQQQQIAAAGGEQQFNDLQAAKQDYDSLGQMKNRSFQDEARYKNSALKLSKAGLLSKK